MATRLYQNNARVHFNQHVEKEVGLERELYTEDIISLARALSCNGLANTFKISAIHSGKHSSQHFLVTQYTHGQKLLKKIKLTKILEL